MIRTTEQKFDIYVDDMTKSLDTKKFKDVYFIALEIETVLKKDGSGFFDGVFVECLG